jgi:hypothetical protein
MQAEAYRGIDMPCYINSDKFRMLYGMGGGGGNTLIIKPRESKADTKMLTTFAIKKWLVLYMVVAPIF